MKILVLGATGTIGKAVAEALSQTHEVVRVGHSQGDYTVDLASQASIQALFAQIGQVDAVVSVAGQAAFNPLTALSDADFELGLSNKLMGQINLVRLGLDAVKDGGSFTLTSGVLSQEPMPGGAAISMVNSGLEGFVRSAALEMPRNLRINVVSPPWVKETMEAMGMDSTPGMPAVAVAKAYVSSVEGTANGTTLDARQFA
ncbi:MAG: short chain dehydrogenase [Candidatus Sericytochromatia bacterium]